MLLNSSAFTNKYTIFLLIMLLSTTICRQLQVPSIKIQTKQSMKLGRLEQVKQPSYQFKYVQSRSVTQADAQSTSFPPCRQNKPQIEFTITDNVVFENHPSKPLVVYKFQDIKYSQYLLDTYYDGKVLYMIFENGIAATVTINADKKAQNKKQFQITGLDKNTRLSPGYLIPVGDKVIFINDKHAITVNQNSANKIDGYQPGNNFVTAITLDKSFIAVGYQQTGVAIYKLFNERLQLVTNINSQKIKLSGIVQITDLAYYQIKKALLVLDQDSGILAFNVQYSSDNGTITISQSYTLLKRQSCQLMNLNKNRLFVACSQIYQISLENWPKIQQKTLPHPNLKIREIYADGPVAAFVGRNIFRLMYFNRLVNYYQDQKMDKLIFNKQLFISANQGGILIGKYQIVQPYITCQTFDETMVGLHPLIFKTLAQCNQQFFKQFGIQMSGYTANDRCLYTVQKTLYFWRTGQIMILPIIIVLSVLLLIALGVGIIFILKKININRFQKQLAEYTALTVNVDNQKHQQLVEQSPETGNNQSGAANKQQQDVVEQKKTQQIEMQNHDIE